MRTGPAVRAGHDLVLTELAGAGTHPFFVAPGTDRGASLLAAVPHREASSADCAAARDRVDQAAQRMGRTMDTTDIHRVMVSNPNHPRWDEVAARCLSCANCTMVCPTCFCTSMEDTTDLTGTEATRARRWDSCFTMNFSYIHGGSIRPSVRARYRQWLTHKLATWIDQFGTSGCVGCGRCITWCPAGIDITAEVRALRIPPRPGSNEEKDDAHARA
jgi:ferredoxin